MQTAERAETSLSPIRSEKERGVCEVPSEHPSVGVIQLTKGRREGRSGGIRYLAAAAVE